MPSSLCSSFQRFKFRIYELKEILEKPAVYCERNASCVEQVGNGNAATQTHGVSQSLHRAIGFLCKVTPQLDGPNLPVQIFDPIERAEEEMWYLIDPRVGTVMFVA